MRKPVVAGSGGGGASEDARENGVFVVPGAGGPRVGPSFHNLHGLVLSHCSQNLKSLIKLKAAVGIEIESNQLSNSLAHMMAKVVRISSCSHENSSLSDTSFLRSVRRHFREAVDIAFQGIPGDSVNSSSQAFAIE